LKAKIHHIWECRYRKSLDVDPWASAIAPDRYFPRNRTTEDAIRLGWTRERRSSLPWISHRLGRLGKNLSKYI